jgi:hypothetical protein
MDEFANRRRHRQAYKVFRPGFACQGFDSPKHVDGRDKTGHDVSGLVADISRFRIPGNQLP